MKPKAVYADGQMVGTTPYRVVRFLGGGGMGTVYEVEDTSIGKHYVLKTLHGDLAHRADLAELLRQEARLLARVKHKNIVDVITAGKTLDQHGLPYIVMEKLDGVTLKGLMQTRRLPWQFVRQIANELLEALFRMHHPIGDGLPLIHRDIKPENIFLAKDDDGKYITKVLDLGIASWLDGQKQAGFHGTLKYAAPEQVKGEHLSERTDLYQAGLVIFEMLAGQHPFAFAKNQAQMIEAALVRPAPRLSQFIGVPKRVDDVIAAALSKNPADRPRDAYVFMTALQDLHDQPASRAPFSNTTIEDLHTAIAKQANTGYEAYATQEGTLEGMSAPPFGNRTIEDAYPFFAVASTDVPRGDVRATIPFGMPVEETPGAAPDPGARDANAKENAGAGGAGGGDPRENVDRHAPTRSRKPLARKEVHDDTEELLEGLLGPALPPSAAPRRKLSPAQVATKPSPGASEHASSGSSSSPSAPPAGIPRTSESPAFATRAMNATAAQTDPSTAAPLEQMILSQSAWKPKGPSKRMVLFVGALIMSALLGVSAHYLLPRGSNPHVVTPTLGSSLEAPSTGIAGATPAGEGVGATAITAGAARVGDVPPPEPRAEGPSVEATASAKSPAEAIPTPSAEASGPSGTTASAATMSPGRANPRPPPRTPYPRTPVFVSRPAPTTQPPAPAPPPHAAPATSPQDKDHFADPWLKNAAPAKPAASAGADKSVKSSFDDFVPTM